MDQQWYVKNQLPVDPQGSAPGSISYMWDHLTYPEMTLTTQQPPSSTMPDGNLLQRKITRQTVICYFTNQPTSSFLPDHSYKFCRITKCKAGSTAEAHDKSPVSVQDSTAHPRGVSIMKSSKGIHCPSQKGVCVSTTVKGVISFDRKTALPTPNGVAKQCSMVIPSSSVGTATRSILNPLD